MMLVVERPAGILMRHDHQSNAAPDTMRDRRAGTSIRRKKRVSTSVEQETKEEILLKLYFTFSERFLQRVEEIIWKQ